MLKVLTPLRVALSSPAPIQSVSCRLYHSVPISEVPKISTHEKGAPGSFEYRVFFESQGKRISPWHSIPLVNKDKVFNYVNEMPKGTDAKMEICKTEEYNPIKQDIKKGALRVIKHGKLQFNYGALPQTWEDPTLVSAVLPKGEKTYPGDNDPLDVVEISPEPAKRGAVLQNSAHLLQIDDRVALLTPKQVKALGALGLIDEGETDWKIIAINVNDKNAHLLNDVGDIEKVYPGTVEAIRTWYKVYKVADGKEPNSYAFDGKALSAAKTHSIIEEAHEAWKKLRAGEKTMPGFAVKASSS